LVIRHKENAEITTVPHWSSGYRWEIGYTYGYFPEISPQRLRFAALAGGAQTRQGRPLRYLELGFGQGLSLNIHAAACPGEYWGVDFNPAHAAQAREMADSFGSDARIFDLSFEELARRQDDLPDFDVIVLHGIWSWISEEAREAIVELARRKLSVGGLFYISYNCPPGWAPATPLRHLLNLHAEVAGSDAQGLVGKIDAALNFAQKVVDSDALYFKANPAVGERLKQLTQQNRAYLAHEFFNRSWQPSPFSEVAGQLGAAKLEFAASAHLLDQVDVINFTLAGRQLLSEISHPVLRQSVRDYLINQQFRRDIFVKGLRPLPLSARRDGLMAQRFVLGALPQYVSMKMTGPLGEVDLHQDLYGPVLEALACESHRPKSFKDVLEHPSWRAQDPDLLMQCLQVLISMGVVHPVQHEADVEAARSRCQALNAHLCHRARDSGDVEFLASPVTGAGVPVGRIDQLFLQAHALGIQAPVDMATSVWSVLTAQGQRLTKEGKALQTDEENIAELVAQASLFADRKLVVFQAFGLTN
jgi:hypothetical protein